MTAKLTASADGSKVLIGTAAEDALQIDATAKTINPLAPYTFGNGQSLTGNGYIKLPGGLIIQWGQGVTDAASEVPVTFPIPFPTAVVLTLAGGSLNDKLVYPNKSSTLSGFVAYARSIDTGGGLGPGYFAGWIALGF